MYYVMFCVARLCYVALCRLGHCGKRKGEDSRGSKETFCCRSLNVRKILGHLDRQMAVNVKIYLSRQCGENFWGTDY
jgi:hypothetical protein